MDRKRLRAIAKKYRLPEGLLEDIIRIERDHQFQLNPRGVQKDIEDLLRKHAGRHHEA